MVPPATDPYGRLMITLHIEHPITDFARWRTAFDAFEAVRRDAGVTAHRISRPIGDENYVVVALEFDSVGRAESFLEFLSSQVWASSSNAPALGGEPRTAILEPVDSGPGRPGVARRNPRCS